MKPRKVLLLEPNYKNKFPPIGLMKLATYFRNRGDEVVFFKGNLKHFVIDRIVKRCIRECEVLDPNINIGENYKAIYSFIKTRKSSSLKNCNYYISPYNLLIEGKIIDAKDFYWNGSWKEYPEWDFIGVTTLFTFYWDITIETINFAKLLLKPSGTIMIGGVLASIQPEKIKEETGIDPHIGVLNQPGIIDEGDNQIIDELPLDYSILDEIDYQYPMSNAYYGYTSRGCVRTCPFCAVKTLEPNFIPYIPLKNRIDGINETYGAQKDLLLMDNNILASKDLPRIIGEIIKCGFGKGQKFIAPNMFNKSFENLQLGINDKAYIRRCFKEVESLYNKLREKKTEDSYTVYHAMADYSIYDINTVTKENLLQIYPILKPINEKYFKPIPKQRYVDFNQGVDARLFDEEKVKLLASIAIRPLRIAFDNIKTREIYEKAVRLSAKAGIKDFSNYLLYNYDDKPEDLYLRLRINVDLCEELGVSIYSFPMKYHPIQSTISNGIDFSHNRDYIGINWNRKYIRAVQAILNSTKGKVGKGVSFFEEAFGENLMAFKELLEMPETFILYRFFFKWLDKKADYGIDHWRKCWRKCMTSLNDDVKNEVLSIIHLNKFDKSIVDHFHDPLIKELLSYYLNDRNDVINPKSKLFKYKQQYDENPTYTSRRK